MANISAMHTVLTTCGVGVAPTCNVIINVEGFYSLSALGMLETEGAWPLGGRPTDVQF